LGALVALSNAASWDAYTTALQQLDWAQVDADILNLLTTPNSSWIPDYGNYGPFFIRLAWHCSGSYRQSDGRGGCSGARIRFAPEMDWDDNANLNHARDLLEPIKAKYGLGLSYGDLYVRTANVAIKSMGGPVLGFCAGRMDDTDGSASLNFLGPSAVQAINYPCPTPGDCLASSGLGPTTIGLIYVNPEGPEMSGDPVQSAPQIRDTFGRMGMSDKETVSLIGGGHSFGKTHGACNNTAAGGMAPSWIGDCNSSGPVAGQGVNTFTSGFEGPWTTTPTRWSNQYYQNLMNLNWTIFRGPGGHQQFQVAMNSPMAPRVDNVSDFSAPIAMLVSDISLTKDANFSAIVNWFASNLTDLEATFAAAWFKLTSNDMGPSKRCYGTEVPPSQPFQHDLPAPSSLPNYTTIKGDIRGVLYTDHTAAGVTPDVSGVNRYNAQFAQLAWQCASTYRATDFRGGCNGARIRFPPESNFQANQDLGSAALLSLLQPVKTKYPSLSWADLIVLAGHTAVEDLLGFGMPFCGGRTDATDGSGSMGLNPPNWSDPVVNWREKAARMGLTDAEAVVLTAVPRKGTSVVGTSFFAQIVGTTNMAGTDALVIRNDTGLLALAQAYSTTADANAFMIDFTNAWNKVMNADYFIGWNNLTCPGPVAAMTPPAMPSSTTPTPSAASASQLSVLALVLSVALVIG
jgi:catalase (peroxidase I)